jgi:prepilin-type N-terminal cleavage/methylation domain-containing protein
MEKNKGFTLIELILTMALLGMILGIAVPKIDNSNFYLKAQGKQLCMEIRNVRILRMTEGKGYRILLSDHSYKVLDGRKELKNIILDSKYELLYRNRELMFTYEGTPCHGGDTIIMRNRMNGKHIKITIVPASGRVLLDDKIY